MTEASSSDARDGRRGCFGRLFSAGRENHGTGNRSNNVDESEAGDDDRPLELRRCDKSSSRDEDASRADLSKKSLGISFSICADGSSVRMERDGWLEFPWAVGWRPYLTNRLRHEATGICSGSYPPVVAKEAARESG